MTAFRYLELWTCPTMQHALGICDGFAGAQPHQRRDNVRDMTASFPGPETDEPGTLIMARNVRATLPGSAPAVAPP
jgi:hypothetical protein